MFPLELGQTGSAPAMEQAGLALTVKLGIPVVAKSPADVSALTVKLVLPEGVAAVVVIVSVVVFEVSLEVNETGFGEKDAVAPVGRAVVTLMVAVKLPLLPGPLPLLTVTV